MMICKNIYANILEMWRFEKDNLGHHILLAGFIILIFKLIQHIIYIMPSFLIPYKPRKPYQNINTPTIVSPEQKKSARGFCHISEAYEVPREYPDFITSEEGEYILEQASKRFSESTTVNGLDHSMRKSQTAWLNKTDPVISNIIQRVCNLTNQPFSNAELMQVVKYDVNGYYLPHHDSCCDDTQNCIDFEKDGGQRMVTMLIYLSDDFQGGSTRFPLLLMDYKPDKWGALLFYPLQKNGVHGEKKAHPLALHAGTPVTSGNKYIANIWIRESKYRN